MEEVKQCVTSMYDVPLRRGPRQGMELKQRQLDHQGTCVMIHGMESDQHCLHPEDSESVNHIYVQQDALRPHRAALNYFPLITSGLEMRERFSQKSRSLRQLGSPAGAPEVRAIQPGK